MKEKIKKTGLTLFYLFVWAIFFFSLLGVFAGLSDIENIEKWDIFLIFSLLPFLSGYLLRNHFKFLFSTIRSIWEKGILYKVIIIAIPIVIVGGIWWFQHQALLKECKMQCRYYQYEKVWKYEGGRLISRSFPSQEQCIDYCLIVK